MLGYAAFLALMFLPGLAVLFLFRLASGGIPSILSRSYGLSLVLNSFIGYANNFAGLPYLTLSLLDLAVPLLVLVLILLLRRRTWTFSETFHDVRADLPVLLIAFAFGAVLLSEFIKYPYFPKSYSIDFIQHTRLVEQLFAGGSQNLIWTIFYGGVHINLAMGLSLEGGNALVQLPYLMALLAAPSSVLAYEVGFRLYRSREMGLLVQALYLVTGFVWYVPLYDSGLYPNLYGEILSLAYIVVLLDFSESKEWKSYLVLFAMGAGLYLSHFSSALFIGTVDLYMVIALLLKRQSLKFASAVIASNLAPLALLLVRPDLLSLASQLLSSTAVIGAFPFSTPLADALSFDPFMHYLVAEIYGYTGVILLVFALPLSFYFVWLKRKTSQALLLIPIWVVVVWALSPSGEISWRYSNVALAPLVVLAPGSFSVMAGALNRVLAERRRQKSRKGRIRPRSSPRSAVAVTLALLIILFAGSWSNVMFTDLTTNTGDYAAAQSDLYHSMLWFNQSTPSGSTLLSVTDWRIEFMQQLTGRYGSLLLFANSTQAFSYAKANRFGYILVTYLIPSNVLAGFDAVSYYNSFSGDSNLKEVYSNPTDVIYQVAS